MANSKTPWGYEGEGAPENWGSLDTRFKICDTGVAQSPIDLKAGLAGSGSKTGFHYRRTSAYIHNDGRSLHVELRSGGSIQLDGERFFLKQFHLHAPSEHALLGKFFPMEIHLVHSNRAGDLAVVGIFVREGTAHELFDALWEPLPLAPGESFQYDFRFNSEVLLPSGKSHFRYDGSLTTPPCSENVRWIVFEEPIEVSRKQLQAFTRHFSYNRRPIQPLNGRKIAYFNG